MELSGGLSEMGPTAAPAAAERAPLGPTGPGHGPGREIG